MRPRQWWQQGVVNVRVAIMHTGENMLTEPSSLHTQNYIRNRDVLIPVVMLVPMIARGTVYSSGGDHWNVALQ